MLKRKRSQRAVWLVVALLLMGVAAVATVLSQAGVRVAALSPGRGDDDVPITAPIRITFSKEMDRTSVEERFSVEPEIPGEFEWESKTLTLRPYSALRPETTYVVTLRAGATTERGKELREETRASFRTRAPQLLYLGWADESTEVRQLFAAALDGGAPRQLTENATGVWDYAVHPEGAEIVYSVLREDGGSDLWSMDRDGGDQRMLLPCPEVACLNPAWSPNGTILAYERRDVWADAPNLDAQAGRIWLLDVEEGEERPLFDYDVALHSPAWSPEGERLAYVSPMLPGIEVLDLVTGELQQYGNEWGATPVWSPDGTALIVPELMFEDELLVVRLVRINLEPGELLDISGDEGLVKDVGPAWSPGGGWIAFLRQFLGQDAWTPGRQIWLVRPDGSEAYWLLDEPMGDFYALTWRADGAALAYARIDLSEGIQAVPAVSVWVFDLVERKPVLVAEEGVLPQWLP
ncbi:MAG: Ig-like domain-containing protein [Anaerolineae bacterium]|jgi:Tol biopolymer transport system component